jgi:hypothetical protein
VVGGAVYFNPCKIVGEQPTKSLGRRTGIGVARPSERGLSTKPGDPWRCLAHRVIRIYPSYLLAVPGSLDASAKHWLKGAVMTRKIACMLAFLASLTASAQAQQSAPKPAKADAVKVVKIISGDKAKIATYCKLSDLGDEIAKAGHARDNGKVQQLSKQAGDLRKALGPEFDRLSAGLGEVDFQSKEGQEMSTELEKLDQLCPQE